MPRRPRALAYCWNMPGPSCRVTILCLQLHLRLPFAGLMTSLSRPTLRTLPRYKSLMLTDRSTVNESPLGVSSSCSCPPKPPNRVVHVSHSFVYSLHVRGRFTSLSYDVYTVWFTYMRSGDDESGAG